MSVLVDTNVLLRQLQPALSQYRAAIDSVARFLDNGEVVYFTPRNIAEFWNVMTRPVTNNGLGFSVAEALAEIEKIEGTLTLLPDSPAIYPEWRRLIVKHSVQGSKVHQDGARSGAIRSRTLFAIDDLAVGEPAGRSGLVADGPRDGRSLLRVIRQG